MTQAQASSDAATTRTPSGFSGLERASLALLVAAYLGLGLAYQNTIPLFEAPDEPSHIQYVGFISEQGRLPAYSPEPDVPGEGMQPPLYYLAVAPLFQGTTADPGRVLEELRRASLSVYRMDRSAISHNRLLVRQGRPGPRFFRPSPALEGLRVLRWPGLALGLAALLLTYGAVMTATRKPPYALLAAALVAFNPQFLFATSTVNNDGLAVVVGAGALWLLAHFLGPSRGERVQPYYLGLAALAALGVASKLSTLPVLGASALVLFLADARPLGRRVVSAAACAALFALLSSPYLIFNYLQRGDPLGLGAVWASAENLPGPDAFGGPMAYFSQVYFDRLFNSYWARFGWMNVLPPAGLQFFFGALCLVGAAGFARSRQVATPLRLYLAAAFGLSLLVHMGLNLETAQPQGRHLFAASPHLAAVLSLGLIYPVESKGARSIRSLAVAIGGLMALVSLYCLLFVIAPAYDLPRLG